MIVVAWKNFYSFESSFQLELVNELRSYFIFSIILIIFFFYRIIITIEDNVAVFTLWTFVVFSRIVWTTEMTYLCM